MNAYKSVVTETRPATLLNEQPDLEVPRATRVDLLFALGRTTSRIALAAAVVTFLLFLPFGTSPALWLWLALVSATNLIRLFMFRAYQRNSSAHNAEIWLRLHLWSGVATGICWGLLPLHPTEGLDTTYACLVVLVPTAIAAGAVSAYSVFPSHYRAFLTAILGTALVAQLSQHSSGALAAVVVFGFIAAALVSLAHRYHGQIYREMETRLRLEHLNSRLSEVNDELAKHHELLEREQELAAHVHRRLTSGSDTEISNVAVWTKPLGRVSGDLILTVRAPEERIYLFLGDFTGHGLPAALGAVPATQIFLSMARKGIDIETIAAELQTRLSTLLPVGYFCCAALVCADASQGSLSVFNAGVPPVLLKRRGDDALVEFASEHLPLGVGEEPAQTGRAARTGLADGDVVLLYTDGLIELTNPLDQQWGMGRVSAFLAADHGEGSCIARLQDACEAFTLGTLAADDISVIELRAG